MAFVARRVPTRFIVGPLMSPFRLRSGIRSTANDTCKIELFGAGRVPRAHEFWNTYPAAALISMTIELQLPCRAFLITVLAVVPTATLALPSNLEWTRFANDMGTSVQYPSSLFHQSRERPDAQLFTTSDGRAELRVFSFSNERGETPAGYLKQNFIKN